MTQSTPLGKKPTACVPCHERKVRCDSTTVGIPCTRCITKERLDSCILLERGGKSSNKRKRLPAGEDDPVRNSPTTIQTPAATRNTQNGDSGIRDSRLPTVQYMVSEDDAHLQTLCQMGDDDPIIPSPVPLSSSDQGQQVIEYYGEFNSITVLSEVLGQAQRRLIRIDLPGPTTIGAIQKELSRLDQTDVAYLKAKAVHEFPPADTCRAFLRLFFEYVYPYTPIFDRQKFVDDYEHGACSSFLLWSIFANVAPYASRELLLGAGHTEYAAAQKHYFHKARLLYDFGCEKGQLNLLQGSLLLSSFQFSFAPDKDFRFWFHNAVRIATQMGFNRHDIGKHLDPSTYSLARRIWWVLYTRDVWFSAVGFENARRMQESESETLPLPQVEDWGPELAISNHKDLIPDINSVQQHFLRENCHLSLLAARFLYLFPPNKPPPSMTAAQEYTNALSAWRSSLPEELIPDRVSHWTSANAWVLFLWAMSFRLECSFYRMCRQRLKTIDDALASWANNRLCRCIFEFDTVLKRAIVHEVAHYCPPSLIVCVSHLLALQLEVALDPTTPDAQRLTARMQIHTGLAYLREVGHRWLNAKWTYNVFASVTRRMGIAMGEGTDPSTTRWLPDDRNAGLWADDQPAVSLMQPESTSLGPNEAHPNLDGMILPDRWIESLLTQNLVSGLDDGLFNIFAP